MNRWIGAIKELDIRLVSKLLDDNERWLHWCEESGKNALHYACGLTMVDNPRKAETILELVQLLLERGMDINSIHRIPDNDCDWFPATPIWYAYTRGRNELLVSHLLEVGANPAHCMFAIAWNDDVVSAELFRQYGAELEEAAFLAAFNWKRFSMVDWFLEQGVDVNTADQEGNTALLYAISKKHKIAVVEQLLRHGADGNRPNGEGITPRMIASANNRTQVLRLIQRSIMKST